MKKAIVIFTALSFIFVSSAVAGPIVDADPNKMYNFDKGTKTMSVTWHVVDNPLAECDKESKRVGNGGFAYKVQACAFWTKTQCTIITGKRDNHDTIGHEFRHCFQGHWHSQ
jgi:hypothetical protein